MSDSETKTKNRPSPSESATLYKAGFIKYGSDGLKYVIAVNKNGVKRWVLLKTFDSESYIKKSFGDLEKNGIAAISKPIPRYIYRDDIVGYIDKKIISMSKYQKLAKKFWNIERLDKNTIDHFPYIYYVKTTQEPTEINIHHNLPTKAHKQIVDTILRKHFKLKYSWNGSDNRVITIKTGLVPKYKPTKKQKNTEYGAEYGKKIQLDMKKWLIEYPDAKFKTVGNMKRWSSPTIDKYLKLYSILRKELIKRKIDPPDEIYPLTPWISPKDAEEEVRVWLTSVMNEIHPIKSSKIK
jgi:hypothetical protein